MKKALLFATVAATTIAGAQAQNVATDWAKAVQYVRANIKDATADKKADAEAAIVDLAPFEDVASLYAYVAPALASHAIAEGITGRVDMTELIVNPLSLDQLNGWNHTQADGPAKIEIRTDGNQRPTHPDLGELGQYFDGGHQNWGQGNWTNCFEQTITIPAGKYRLALMARGSDNLDWERLVVCDEKDENRVDGHVLNEATTAFTFLDINHVGANGTPAPYENGWYEHSLDFQTEGGDIVIAVQASAQAGSQWLSFTNFRLTKIGEAGAGELLAEATALLNDPEYACVTGEERTKLAAAIAANASSSELQTAMNAFKSAKAAYEKFAAAVAVIVPNVANATAEEKAAINALAGGSPVNAQDATAKSAQLYEVGRPAILSSAQGRGLEGFSDITSMLTNTIPSGTVPENVDGWFCDAVDGYSPGNIILRGGEAPMHVGIEKYFDSDMWDSSEWGVKFYQGTADVEPGFYRVSALLRGHKNKEYYQLFINDKAVEVNTLGNQGGIFERGWNVYYVDIELTEKAPLEVGVKAGYPEQYTWMSFCDFRLSKFSVKPTGITDIEADNNAPVEIFDLQGRPVNGELTTGIYVKRQGNKVSKEIVR